MPELEDLKAERKHVSDLILALAKVGKVQAARLKEINVRIAELTAPEGPEATTQAMPAVKPLVLPSAPLRALQPRTVAVRPSQLAGTSLAILDGRSVHIWPQSGPPLCGLDAALGPGRWKSYQPDLRGWIDLCVVCGSRMQQPRQETR